MKLINQLFILTILIIFFLSSCRTMTNFILPINEKTIKKKELIEIWQGKSKNDTRLQIFIDNIKKGKIDKIILVYHNREGDPIIKTIKAKKRNVIIKNDNRRDKYAAFSDIFILREKIRKDKFSESIESENKDFLKLID
ncbi:MAG: DUF4362 domain-containing protein [Vicingaceae bacterium]|nr:DUF4362 domain-containing protein [Vicingaceae bacterium]